MNNGLSEKIQEAFPNILPVIRPVVKLPEKLNPE
jgi:hypothetical protein